MGFVWWVPSALVALLVVVVPLATFSGLLGPQAFFAFFAGVGLGAVATIVLGGLAAFATATGRPWRARAVRATAIPLLCTLAVLSIAVMGGGTGHPVHDVTTDLEDTLRFTPDVAALEQLPMPREAVLETQQQIYPDLQPLVVPVAPEEAFEQALALAHATPRWQVEEANPAALRIEATATSRIFGFTDDVLIRVSAEGDGSRIDVRSRSRMGRSDLGANAARIRSYLAALSERL